MTDAAAARDRHLFGAGPKRILSLDGGGVRGALSIAFLERIEALLATGARPPVSLSDHFDLVGGTSTGAIIAGGLALGLSAGALHDLYHRLARKIFRHEWWRFPVLQAKFDAAHLRAELQAIVGDRRLDSPDLRTGFCVVTKRMDTGSPWILANNPRGRFWNDPPDGQFIGNRAFPLAALIRASTAAPHYFKPEVIDVLAAGEQGLFVDGAISPFNNPALQLTLLATLPQHGIGWPLGPRNLTVVSVGTGTFRNQMPIAGHGRIPALGLALRALAGLIGDTQSLTVGLMQALGETPTPWAINSEVGAMEGLPLPGGPLFRHIRYDVRLETEWLREYLDLTLAPRDVLRLRRMDDPGCVADLYGIGKLAAERQVRAAHLGLEGPIPP